MVENRPEYPSEKERSPFQDIRTYREFVDSAIRQVNESAHNPEQLKALEKELVKLELQRQKESGSEMVLSPRLLSELLDYKEEIEQDMKDGKAGGAYLFYGLPGVGKSQFALELLRSLGTTSGVIRINASPTARFEEQFAKSDEEIKRALTVMTELLEQQTFHERLVQLVEFKVWTNNGTPSQMHRAFESFLAEIRESVGNIPLSTDGTENPMVLAKKLEHAVSQDENIKHKLELFCKQELTRLLAFGLVAQAAEGGFGILADELEKEHMNDVLRAAAGAEGVLSAKIGEFLSHKGVTLQVKKGFIIVGTANNVQDMAEWTVRDGRLVPKHFSIEAEDLFFTARVLLSDEEGNYLLEDKPKDDSELTKLLLWFKSFSVIPKGIQMNSLVQLCTRLKRGASFSEALHKILKDRPEALEQYQTYADQSNGRARASLREYTLHALTGAAINESLTVPVPQTIAFDRTKKRFYTKSSQDEVLMMRSVEQTQDVVSVLASSSHGQRVVARGEQNISFYDIPTGNKMEIAFLNRNRQEFRNKAQMEATFITDQKGLLYSRQDNFLYIYPFEIVASDRSTTQAGQTQTEQPSGYMVRIINEYSLQTKPQTTIHVQGRSILENGAEIARIDTTTFSTRPLQDSF